jgi:hypothetical protein
MLAQISVRPFQCVIENPVIGFQFGQLKVGEFHDVKRFLEIGRFFDNQRGVPVDDGEIIFVVAEIHAGRFGCFLS